MAFAPATTPKGDHVLSLAGGRRVAWAEWVVPAVSLYCFSIATRAPGCSIPMRVRRHAPMRG
jgi:hypothetical protein